MRLHQAIDLWSASEAGNEPKQPLSGWSKRENLGLTAQAIPIKRVGTVTSITYVCAIAHRLAAKPHHAAIIAAQLVSILQRDLPSHLKPLLQEVTVHATAAGLIHFEVGDRAIAVWLDSLLNNTPKQSLPLTPVSSTGEPERQLMLHSSAIFEVQHAHARCCSLLQLAHREALISLERLEEAPLYWYFSSPASMPWLTSADQLCCNHCADRCLLSQLLDACDHLSDPARRTQGSLLRSAQAVAQAFQVFHREHPLRGTTSEELRFTLVRLGLLISTQRVLYTLLWDGLGLYPAVDL